MKRIIIIFMICMLAAGLCSGCSSDTAQGKTGDRLKIITTIFPEYDWVKEILGDKADKAELTLLLDNGVDLHSYQPTAGDILAVSGCDMFIYVGGESDAWVEDVLRTTANKHMAVINLMEVLGSSVKTEETVEGMEHEHDHDEDGDHDHDHDEDHEDADHEDDHDHEEEYDEHVWLSLRNARIICGVIADKLAELDPDNAGDYKANYEAYDKKLSALDEQIGSVVGAASVKTLLFGDRFPFRYLTDDYGLAYYAAFSGCSAETEASFKTIVFLADKVNELKLPAILTIENSDGKIASTIRENTADKNQKILQLHSLQSVTSKDIEKGASYISIMNDNIAVLKEALEVSE